MIRSSSAYLFTPLLSPSAQDQARSSTTQWLPATVDNLLPAKGALLLVGVLDNWSCQCGRNDVDLLDMHLNICRSVYISELAIFFMAILQCVQCAPFHIDPEANGGSSEGVLGVNCTVTQMHGGFIKTSATVEFHSQIWHQVLKTNFK